MAKRYACNEVISILKKRDLINQERMHLLEITVNRYLRKGDVSYF